jgi:predicted AlkP superfamily pyrophosphatase or phosphodiesterase
MRLATKFAALLGLMTAAPAIAQTAPPPKLLVVVSVDQFSADIFAEYRGQFRGGFARLLSGAVFPSGYQSHAATETCPGHSTILTGARPSRTGIVANDWIDLKLPGADKSAYCVAEDGPPGPDGRIAAAKFLRVSTLGEWMKAANPASRIVSVAGKDRSALMMAGHNPDEVWFWNDGKRVFQSYSGRATPAMVTRMNEMVAARIAEERKPDALPDFCKARSRAVPVGDFAVGDGNGARAAGDWKNLRTRPDFDESIVALAAGLASDMKLGRGSATDLLIVGASGTDYTGHAYGTEGSEMCLQLLSLDQHLGNLFAVLDRDGIDYAVALTADHGGLDIPERHREHAAPDAARVDAKLNAGEIGKAVAAKLGLTGQILWGGSFGDVYVGTDLPKPTRDKVLAEAIKLYKANPQVHSVFTRAEILATLGPKGSPENWSLLERVRASFDAERSGDFYVVLQPGITPIAAPAKGSSTATHGSIWNYDRRVPILFWRKGMTNFEQPMGVETVDIAPTLAALIGLKVPVAIDGRCLDLDAGAGSICP